MAGMSDSKKHHFVPQSLLKNFYGRDGQIFVFDKVQQKSFPTSSENVGHENYFNSIEVDGEKVNFENFYQQIDSDQATLFRKITSFENAWDLTEDEIWKLAYFTLVQMHRTKLTRTSIVEFSNDLQNWMDELNENTAYQSENAKINHEQSKLIALEQINSIPESIHHLLERTLHIVKAPQNCAFDCSDSPVVMYNPYPYLKVSIGGVGTNICFPISKTLLVNFTCSTISRKIHDVYQDCLKRNIPIPLPIDSSYREFFNREILELEPKYVDFYNHLQVAGSSRFLYSSKNDFTIAREMIERSPELKEVKATIGLGNRPMSGMTDGEYIVLFFENKDHCLVSVELLKSDYDLCFKVSEKDNWKITTHYASKQPIEFVRVFKDKMEIRGMGNVEIASYDMVQRLGCIKHKDNAIVEILKSAREHRLKRET